MKILILGSNGFIGKNLVKYFDIRNHEILAPKRQDLDLLDQEAISSYLEKNLPDIVINSAITIHSVETNLAIHFNIDRCHKYYDRLINIGSGAEYSSKHYTPMMRESYFGTHIPIDTYGISKFTIARDIEKSSNNSVNLRVFGIFGEHEDHSRRFISNNICSALRDNTITVNRNSIFDYIDILDFAGIVERFLTAKLTYKSFNICTAKPRELIELASIIDTVSDQDNVVTVLNETIHQNYSGDNDRMLREIGPFDFTPMEQSISRLFNWYKTEFTSGRIT